MFSTADQIRLYKAWNSYLLVWLGDEPANVTVVGKAMKRAQILFETLFKKKQKNNRGYVKYYANVKRGEILPPL